MRLDPLDLFNLNHSIDRLFNVLVFWFLLKAFESCIANDCHSYNTTYNDGCDNFVAKDSVGLLSTQRELLACEVRPGVGLTALSSALGIRDASSSQIVQTTACWANVTRTRNSRAKVTLTLIVFRAFFLYSSDTSLCGWASGYCAHSCHTLLCIRARRSQRFTDASWGSRGTNRRVTLRRISTG